jgi:hypothetical protein
MPLTKLQFRPGINKEITSYSNEGGWVDGDKIRFRFGFPEKIGGWNKYTSSTYLGTPRTLHAWVTLASDRYLAVGTNVKYYIESGGDFNDITPVRLTVRRPFDVSGVEGETSVGTVTVINPIEVATTTVSATASVGTVTILTEPIQTPLVGTTGLGSVTVVASDVNVPVGD